jgi:hypothetical protein
MTDKIENLNKSILITSLPITQINLAAHSLFVKSPLPSDMTIKQKKHDCKNPQ